MAAKDINDNVYEYELTLDYWKKEELARRKNQLKVDSEQVNAEFNEVLKRKEQLESELKQIELDESKEERRLALLEEAERVKKQEEHERAGLEEKGDLVIDFGEFKTESTTAREIGDSIDKKRKNSSDELPVEESYSKKTRKPKGEKSEVVDFGEFKQIKSKENGGFDF